MRASADTPRLCDGAPLTGCGPEQLWRVESHLCVEFGAKENAEIPAVGEAVTTLRIGLQQQQRLFREGLAFLFSAQPDVSIVGLAVTREDLVGMCREATPDVVVLEADAVGWDMCRLTSTLVRRHRRTRFVGLYTALELDALARARDSGMRSLVARSDGFGPLSAAVRSAFHSTQVASVSPATERRSSLTPREVEVLELIGAGRTSREVGQRLGISQKTVQNHKQRIFVKLDVQSQAHAVAVAVRKGSISAYDMMQLAAEA